MKNESGKDADGKASDISKSDSSDDENNEIQDKFEYGRIEPTDPQKDYTTL